MWIVGELLIAGSLEELEATSLLKETSSELEREQILKRFCNNLQLWIEKLRAGNSSELLENYRQRDALIGREVRWVKDGNHKGVARGVSSEGNLIVESKDGEQQLNSGEVHLNQ